MLYLIFAGVIALVFGVLFLFSPQTIRDLSEKVNQTIGSIDDKAMGLRVGIGISLILSSFLFFFVIYYAIKTYSY